MKEFARRSTQEDRPSADSLQEASLATKIVRSTVVMKLSKRNQTKTLSYSMTTPMLTVKSFRGTILPVVLKRPEHWVLVAIHTTFVLIKEYHDKDFFSSWGFAVGDMSETIGLMTFMLVFFNGQCYSRYLGFYDACTGMTGTLFEINQLIATDLGESTTRQWNVMRYLTSSCMATYMKVYDRPGRKARRLFKDEEWGRLLESEAKWLGHPVKAGERTVECPPLLHEDEVRLARNFTGNRAVLFQTWAIREARRAYMEQSNDSGCFDYYVSLVHKLRQKCAFISNTLALPIPFPYFHALILLMYVNWGLMTIAFLDLDSSFSPFLLFLVIVVTSGIREVSVSLANPFGLDEVDFPVQEYMTTLRANIAPLVFDMPWPPDPKESTRSRHRSPPKDHVPGKEKNGNQEEHHVEARILAAATTKHH